jgi:hypothetical protein
MMTSYFGNPAIKNDPAAISIARFTPRWWGAGRRYIKLAPPVDLLNRSRNGLPWEDYVREYNIWISCPDPGKIWNDLHNCILVCYEKPGENYHRRLVAAWLENALNVKIPEL